MKIPTFIISIGLAAILALQSWMLLAIVKLEADVAVLTFEVQTK
jgi:hypothetical protein